MSKCQFIMRNSNVIPMLCLDMFKCQLHMGNSNVIPMGLHLHVDYQNLAIYQRTN